tara:strand:+ start:207 stop:809 length:603 start_codon:yes stop_codon:yes gene_type:complete
MKKFDFTKQLPTHLSDRYEKEYFLIFSIIVAGRNAKMATEKTWELLKWASPDETPFQYLQFQYPQGQSFLQGQSLICLLKKAKIGQYNRIKRAIQDAITLDVETCTLEDLLDCYGIGNKTARFFLLNVRKDVEYAALDTHILKWVDHHLGRFMDIPNSTPTNNTLYKKIEYNAIKLMKKYFPDLTLAQADFEIWKQYAKG